MTQRLRRLTRLHAMRRAGLLATARRLAAATAAAVTMTTVKRQIDQLRAGAPPLDGLGSGYALKSAAASGAALLATATRHAVRTTEAESRRAALAGQVQRDTAAADAIERVIERGIAEAAMLVEIMPSRRVRQ